MLKIKASKLIHSENFVREPVDKEVRDILSSPSKKVILTGGRGVGKSTVLYSLENSGLGRSEQTICTSPESIIALSREPDNRYDSEYFDYLHELRFANSILYYIKTNYPLAYDKYFKEDHMKVVSKLNEFFNKLNDSYFTEVNFNLNLKLREFSYPIVSRFRDVMNIDKLNLGVDRFDGMFGGSEYYQKLYESYFDMFDKVVLVSDDRNLDAEGLFNNGYSLKFISYGNNEDVLKQIIKHRSGFYENGEDALKEVFTLNPVIERLLQLNGNIDMALDVLYDVKTSIKYNDGTNIRLEEIVDLAIRDKKDYARRLEKMDFKHTFYL